MIDVPMVPAFSHWMEPVYNRVLVRVESHDKSEPLWFLDVIVDGQDVSRDHERIKRSYSSANDALVSARHLLTEVQKGGGK